METKVIKVHEDVHTLIKEQALAVGLNMMDYMRFLAYKNKKGK